MELLAKLRRLIGGPAATPPTPQPAATAPAPGQPPVDLTSLRKAVQQFNLRKERATVLLYLDRSSSTNEHPNYLWTDGTMHLLVNMVAAIAQVFSARRSATLRFFNFMVLRPRWPVDGQINEESVGEVIDRNKELPFGGTYFVPVLLDMVRQALLLDASNRFVGTECVIKRHLIEGMRDSDLQRFITPDIDKGGHEILKPLLKLPHPILAVLSTDGMCAEKLEALLQFLRWLSQIGVYVLLVGTGHGDFTKLKGMHEAGENLFMKKGLRPLWNNADFYDLKDLTDGEHRVPDGPKVVETILTRFMDHTYAACSGLELIED